MKPALVLATLLVLAACSPEAPAAIGPKPAPAAEPAAPAALDGPVAGRWRITRTVLGQALPPEEICYEKQTPLSQTQTTQEQGNIACSDETATRTGETFSVHRVCTMEVMDKTYTLTTDMKATGDFAKKYSVDITVRSEPELMKGMGEQRVRSLAERLGECDPK